MPFHLQNESLSAVSTHFSAMSLDYSLRDLLRRLNKVSHCYNSVCEMMKDTKEGYFITCRQTINIFATLLLGNTLRALIMTSYRSPWQHARSTKRPSKFQFLKIIRKIRSMTNRFYFFVGNLPKFFNFLKSIKKKSYLLKRRFIAYESCTR